MSTIVDVVHARRTYGLEDFARHLDEEFAYVLSGRARCTATRATWCSWGMRMSVWAGNWRRGSAT